MASSSLILLHQVAPEFQRRPEHEKSAALSAAAAQLDPEPFGDQYQRAAVFLAAHDLKMQSFSRGDATAPSLKKDEDDYDLTTYGKAFKRMRNLAGFWPLVVSTDT